MQRDRHLASLVQDRRRHEAAGEESRGDQARLHPGEAHADRDHTAGTGDRSGDPGQREERVDGRAQLGDGLVDERQDQPVDDVGGNGLARGEGGAEVGTGAVHDRQPGPLTAAGEFERRRGGADPGECLGPAQQARVHRLDAARVPQEHERTRRGRGPQDAGHVPQGEPAL